MKDFLKKNVKILSIITGFSLFISFSFAQQGRWGSYGSSPLQVFETIVDEANNGSTSIQKTAVDGVTDLEGTEDRKFKITNTIDYFRQNIDPYLQWIAYIGLVLSTVGLILSGTILVSGGLGKAKGFEKVKGRIVNALIGVFLLSGSYVIIDLFISVVNTIFGG